ncbi:MAG: hypothetical protein RL653_2508 [Pseudomonadota bacterium]
MQVLEWAYGQALRPGIPGVESVDELIATYRSKGTSRWDGAESLVRWQAARCAGTGFVLAFGGVASLPLALTADLATSYFLQLRMVAAIAGLGGRDPHHPEVRSECIECVLADEEGAHAGPQALGSVMQRLASKRFLARTAPKSLRRVGRVVPVVGGVINGSMNGVLTWQLGKRAMTRFL